MCGYLTPRHGLADGTVPLLRYRVQRTVNQARRCGRGHVWETDGCVAAATQTGKGDKKGRMKRYIYIYTTNAYKR